MVFCIVGKGWDIGGEDENLLTVNLLTPVYPGENVKISISYTLELALVNHRTGITENTVNLGNFYPVVCIVEIREIHGAFDCACFPVEYGEYVIFA